MIRRLLVTGLLAGTMIATGSAQGGGSRRPGGAAGGEGAMVLELTRLETLSNVFKFEKDQKKQVKTILDDAHKSAAPIRGQLATTRAAIGAAIQAGKSQAEVDAAVKAYAGQATAMTEAEMKALAQVLRALNKEQGANTDAVQTAFFMMRGIFLDDKKWDVIAGSRGY